MGTSGGMGGLPRATDPPRWPSWSTGEDLTRLEEEMLTGVAIGELVDCGEGPFELAEMQTWGKERTVRAPVLQQLLISERWPASAKGVQLRGVRIAGHLDLNGVTLRCPFLLTSCYLDAAEPADFQRASATEVVLVQCHLADLMGDTLSAGSLSLRYSTLTGPLRLQYAKIARQLDCSGTQLIGHVKNGSGEGTVRGTDAPTAGPSAQRMLEGVEPPPDALVADHIRVGGPVLLGGGSALRGQSGF
jgi:hypothetical protein